MRDGTLGILRALGFAGLMAVTGGCDSSAALPPRPPQASVAPHGKAPEVRSQTDVARNRVWLLTRKGVFLQDRAASAQIVKLEIPGWIWVGAPYGSLPDLALGPKGEAVITSDVVPTLWRIDPETLAVSTHALELDADGGRDVGFAGLVYSSEYGAYFAVSHTHGSLWRIDPMLRRAQKVSLSEPVRDAFGLAVRPRVSERKTERLAGLCAYTVQGPRAIDLAPDQRFAYLRSTSCAIN